MSKPILRALAGETLPTPPVWMMRQAGRYLPEYKATRAQAGDFLTLCYTPDLAAEVTLQPIRRYGFDAAILFADILLVPQAMGAELWFVTGEGPRLSPITDPAQIAALNPAGEMQERLAPVFETLRLVRPALPAETALIGFAGAPWTVATYMIAGQGTPDQGPAHALRVEAPEAFDALMARITEATIEYLSGQITAGAEVVKVFDSWAGSLPAEAFRKYSLEPIRAIIAALEARHPGVPVIAFPRGAGAAYAGFSRATGAAALAIDQSVTPEWAGAHLQPDGCVQGNLDPAHLVTGGPALVEATRHVVAALSGGAHIFNLGHGITPDADPDNVHRMLEAIRG